MKIFEYSSRPHLRKHGPQNYTDYGAYKPWLRDEFTFRCVYCLERELWYPNRDAGFGVDHITAQVNAPHLVVDYDNLVYACNRCNSWKQEHPILNPCEIAMNEHLHFETDGSIRYLSDEGEEFVRILNLDDPERVADRRKFLNLLQRLLAASDNEAQIDIRQWFGFPDNLPDLPNLRPPGGNTRPAGLRDCYDTQREEQRLPALY